MLFLLLIFFIVNILKYHRKKVAFNLEKLKADFDQLDKERERIASDLHDHFGSVLSGLDLHLQCVKTADVKSKEIVQFSQQQLHEVVNSMRRIAFNMMPGVLLRKGLDEALTELLNLMTDASPISVNYEFKAEGIPPAKKIHIYRIAQEIMNNIIKHSKATQVNFTVLRIKNHVELRVADNGIGFDKNLFMRKSAGLGMRNINARAEVLKAKLSLNTLPGKGTAFLIKIPLK